MTKKEKLEKLIEGFMDQIHFMDFNLYEIGKGIFYMVVGVILIPVICVGFVGIIFILNKLLRYLFT